MIKITANQPLFDEIKQIATDLRKQATLVEALGNIVQNDIGTTEEDLQQFKEFVKSARTKVSEAGVSTDVSIKTWWSKVIEHIKECNKEEA